MRFLRTSGAAKRPTAHLLPSRSEQVKRQLVFELTSRHGFPNKPSAIAYDPVLSLLAISTQTGNLSLYGKPGVELHACHASHNAHVKQILFIEGMARIITVCADSSVHLWEVNSSADGVSSLEQIRSLSLSNKVITCCTLDHSASLLLVGTDTGDIYHLNISSFQLTDTVVTQEVVMQNVPEDYRINPGAIECIRLHPTQQEKLMIGFSRGLMVIWDTTRLNAERTYVCNQSLECVCWSSDGTQFISSHNDGCFIIWSSLELTKPDGPHTPYGPFPCKSINSLVWRTLPGDGDWIIFSGGMPRAMYGDKHTVSVIRRDAAHRDVKHVAFDFSSPVVDFILLESNPNDLYCLLVLLEQELVAIDLTSGDWPQYHLPYLHSMHSSAITTSLYVDLCPTQLADQISAYGFLSQAQLLHPVTADNSAVFAAATNPVAWSEKPWPVTGGTNLFEATCSKQTEADGVCGDNTCQLLLTGHEDGSVNIWRQSAIGALHPIYKICTSTLYGTGDEDMPEDAACAQQEDTRSPTQQQEEEDADFPPLRAVGTFDPYTDDPRLAVRRVAFCAETAVLLVAGAAGQVMFWRLYTSAQLAPTLKLHTINLVSEHLDTFKWKGPQPLIVRHLAAEATDTQTPPSAAEVPQTGSCDVTRVPVTATGFQPCALLQMYPPAAVSALSLEAVWGLAALGTGHGFALFDITAGCVVFHKCTLNPSDYAAYGEASMTRGKSFKKSLRESFRRLRKKRGGDVDGTLKSADSSSQVGVSRNTRPIRRTVSATPAATTGSRQNTPVTVPDLTVSNSSSALPQHSTDTAGGGAGNTKAHFSTVERAVEARSEDPAFSSMVRCLCLTPCVLVSNQPVMRSLWVGTNSGYIYVYAIHLKTAGSAATTHTVGDQHTAAASPANRGVSRVTYQLGKELRLKHGAPVLDVHIVDATGHCVKSLKADMAGKSGGAVATAQQHRVVLLSEEQIKVFTLPSMRPYCKHKLTAVEGSRFKRVGHMQFKVEVAENFSPPTPSCEWCMICVTNLGDICVFSLPQLKCYMHRACFRKEDLLGINSILFPQSAEFLYLVNSAVYQRVVLTSLLPKRTACQIEFNPECRFPLQQIPLDPVGDPVVAAVTESGASPNKSDTQSIGLSTVKAAPAPEVDESSSAANISGVKTSHTDTTLDSHNDFISSETTRQVYNTAARAQPEIIEVTREEAARILGDMRDLVVTQEARGGGATGDVISETRSRRKERNVTHTPAAGEAGEGGGGERVVTDTCELVDECTLSARRLQNDVLSSEQTQTEKKSTVTETLDVGTNQTTTNTQNLKMTSRTRITVGENLDDMLSQLSRLDSNTNNTEHYHGNGDKPKSSYHLQRKSKDQLSYIKRNEKKQTKPSLSELCRETEI